MGSFLGYITKMRHLSACNAAVPLWRKKRQIDKNDASSCIEETIEGAHGCSVDAIAEAELVRLFGTK